MKFALAAVILAVMTFSLPAAATVCATGPEGNLCKAKNGDPRAMYMIGREAYLEGRKTGDLSEAYHWAFQAKEAGFLAGKMLLKMIYLQAGDGVHTDFVQAHRWLTTAVESGDDEMEVWLSRLERKMTPEQRAEARQPQ